MSSSELIDLVMIGTATFILGFCIGIIVASRIMEKYDDE